MSFLLQRQGMIRAVVEPSKAITPPDYEILATEMAEGAKLQDRSEWDYERSIDTTNSDRWIVAETHGGTRNLVPFSRDWLARALCKVPKSQNVRVRGWIEAQDQPHTGSVSCRIYLKTADMASGSKAPSGIICRIVRYSSGPPAWEISGTGEATVSGTIASFPAGAFVMQAEVIDEKVRLSIIDGATTTTLGQAAFGNKFTTTNTGLNLYQPAINEILVKLIRLQLWDGITTFDALAPL
jgi:hypothetical protein